MNEPSAAAPDAAHVTEKQQAPATHVAVEHDHSDICDCAVDPLKPVEKKNPEEEAKIAALKQVSPGCASADHFVTITKRKRKWYFTESIMWKDPHGWMDEGPAQKVLTPEEAMEMGIDANQQTIWIVGNAKEGLCRMTTGKVVLSRMENSSVKVEFQLNGKCRVKAPRTRMFGNAIYVGFIRHQKPVGCKLMLGKVLRKSRPSGQKRLPAQMTELVDRQYRNGAYGARCSDTCQYSWFVYGNEFADGSSVYTLDLVSMYSERFQGKLEQVCMEPKVKDIFWQQKDGEPKKLSDRSMQRDSYYGVLADENGPQIALGVDGEGMVFYDLHTGKHFKDTVELDITQEGISERSILKWPCRD